jgi:hypothetical protein
VMSYCRMGNDSDVYLIGTYGGWQCCGCKLISKLLKSREEVLEHLNEHKKMGDKVPIRAIKRLKSEMVKS